MKSAVELLFTVAYVKKKANNNNNKQLMTAIC